MKKLVLWASAALALSVSVFAASKQSEEIRLVAPAEGATVPLLRPLQKEWMSMSRAARVAATKDVTGWRRRMTDPALGGNHPLPVRLAWQCAHPDGRACSGPYAVEVMQRRTGQRFFSAENLKTNAVEVWNLEVGEEYTWCVWCGKEVRGGKFFTEDQAPRVLKWEGVGNVRDHGGWKGCGGRRVKTGRVFRSERLDKITDRGRDRLVRELGVRTDLDLRTPESVAKLKGVSPLGKAVRYSNQSSGSYAGFDTEGGRKNFAETFRWFLNEAEYPVVFHCEKGADRTGSWAFLLNGLLGVSERDLRFDWEVTSSFNANPQFKHRGRYDELVKLVNRRKGKTFTDRVVAYAHDCGITDREIAKWRKMMLEEATLKVGVLSDTHLRLESNSNALGDAFGEFKRRGVDVIVIAGDLVEDGRRAEYELFLKTWTDVFGAKPGKGGAPGLFIAWGNHDYRAASKFRNRTFTPAEADEFMLAHKDEVWRAFFDEPFPGEVYMRTYKGVPFVGAHWRHEDELGPWLKAHAAEIDASKFFVCVHHPHASGTVFGGMKTHCEQLRNDLAAYPNCFSISGHSHRSLANDAALWQGPFTAMGAGTLRETGDGKTKPKTRQGAVMSVYPDRVVVSRIDFISRRPLGPDWELPLKTSVLPQAAVQEKR